jgi:hypothetical protein
VQKVQVLDGSGLFPHSPTRIFIKADARRRAVRTLKRPMKIPGKLPHGPANQPPDYAPVHSACNRDDLQEATKAWYGIVRKEPASLTGISDTYKSPEFKWRSAVGDCAEAVAGQTTPATTWRILARRADAVAALIRKTAEENRELTSIEIKKQLFECRKAPKAMSKKLKGEHEQQMTKWSDSLQAATNANSETWAKSLAKAARKVAEKKEELTRSSKDKSWREWLTANSTTREGLAPPSWSAYRWVKGLAGWTSSPLGAAKKNEGTPIDDEGVIIEDTEVPDHEASNFNLEGHEVVEPLCDQAAVEETANMWADLWAENEKY